MYTGSIDLLIGYYHIIQAYLNLSVVEARHQPLAGHLEATALAGLGPELSDVTAIEDADSDTCVCASVVVDTDQARNCEADRGLYERNGSLLNVPTFLTSHFISRTKSSYNIDSEGYLKLRVSSEQLLDSRVPHEDEPDKTTSADPTSTVPVASCHVTQEESIPVLITTEETYQRRTPDQICLETEI